MAEAKPKKKRNALGRPKYLCVEEIKEKIDAYFKKCEGHVLTDEEGNVIYDKYGKPIIVDKRPPTVTGLALALGFKTRLSLLDYQAKAEYMEVITEAKTYIEQYAEERLYDREGANGAKFSLQNNFKGWNVAAQEKAAAGAPAVNIICDIPRGPAVNVVEEEEEDGE